MKNARRGYERRQGSIKNNNTIIYKKIRKEERMKETSMHSVGAYILELKKGRKKVW